jgi:hypothetical protein
MARLLLLELDDATVLDRLATTWLREEGVVGFPFPGEQSGVPDTLLYVSSLLVTKVRDKIKSSCSQMQKIQLSLNIDT